MLKQANSLALVSAALAALALIGSPGALADRSYGDPAGDSSTAPDITKVGMSHDAAGVVTIAITTNQPTLAPETNFWGHIDTDANAATGFPFRGLGAEHFFLADADGGVIFHVVGNAITIDFASTFTASYANGTLTAQFNRSELGSADAFAIGLEAQQDDADGNTIASDFAPDGAPYYLYSFVEEALTLTVGKPVGAPAQPIAGKPFVVSASVARSDEQAATTGEVTCQARVGKQSLRASGRLAGNSARCSMQVPKGTQRKVLRGSLTVRMDDATPVKKSFKFTVR